MIAVVVGEHLLMSRLEFVVGLLGDAQLDLVDHLRRIQAAEPLAQDRAEQVGVAQVSDDRVGDPRVLHLDRNRPLQP